MPGGARSWLAHPGKYIYPSSCASPVETGLGNELWTLTGWLMIAFSAHATLVLPPFVPYVHRPDAPVPLIPFADVIDAGHFIGAMASIGVSCELPDPLRHARLPRAQASFGWVHYKKKFAFNRTVHLTLERWRKTTAARAFFNGSALNDSGIRDTLDARKLLGSGSDFDHQFIASEVVRAFQPSAAIVRRVHALVEKLQLPERYGCVHARLERDMSQSSYIAKSTTMRDYVRAVVHADSVVKVAGVYVASGDRVTFPARYAGPRLFQAGNKIDFDDQSVYNSSFTYLHASLVDFVICRRARWFVGFGHSSFSRILAEAQHLDNDRGWTSVCPGQYNEFSSSQVSVLHMNWTLCPVNRPLERMSLGWSR